MAPVNYQGMRVALRNIRGRLSATKFANATGVDRSTIYRVESGESQPTIDTLGKWIAPTGLSLSVFIRQFETQSHKNEAQQTYEPLTGGLTDPNVSETRQHSADAQSEPTRKGSPDGHREAVPLFDDIAKGLDDIAFFLIPIQEELHRLSHRLRDAGMDSTGDRPVQPAGPTKPSRS